MATKLVLTISADDQTGLVEQIANTVANAGGNWLESSMSHLAGKFAGIILVEIEQQAQGKLEQDLTALKECGLHIFIDSRHREPPEDQGRLLELEVVAHDRPGIVQELTALLASLSVNVESLHTNCAIAPMSSDHLFEASAVVVLPQGLDDESLTKHLETLSDDLMVELFDLDEEPEQ